MPSSHMTVMVALCLSRLVSPTASTLEKVVWIVLTVLQGYSRIALNYHTLEQVVGGTCFGIIYTLIFWKLWKLVEPWL